MYLKNLGLPGKILTSSRNIPRLVTHHLSISSTWFHVIIYQETIAYLTVYNTYIFKTFRFSGKILTSSWKFPRLVTCHQSISSTWFQVTIYQQTIAYLTVYNTYIFKKFRFSRKNLDVLKKYSKACNSSPVHFQHMVPSKYLSANNCLFNVI